MTSLTELPAGIVTPLWLRVTDELISNSQVPYLEAIDQFGTKIRLLFTASSPGRDLAWEPGTWYLFRNLVHAPSIRERSPDCPECETPLIAKRDAVREAIELTRGLKRGPQFVGTAALCVERLEADGWLGPFDGLDVESVHWRCPSCDDVGAVTAESAATDPGQSDTLAGRIRSALDDLSTESDEPADGDTHLSTTTSFRRQILRGRCPPVSDVTFEAVRSLYTFETTVPDSTILSSVAPTAARAVSTDPVSGEPERFCDISVNARSFDWSRGRPSLDLVFVIDVSGSMGAPFERTDGDTEVLPSKLTRVCESLAGAVQRLNPSDRVGVVFFDTDARTVKPLQSVEETSHETLRTVLADTTPAGNTNPMEGLRHAGRLFDNGDSGRPDTERRIVMLSDTTPTVGASSIQQYIDRCVSYQDREIGTSFVGLDFPAVGPLRELCRVPGTNVSVVDSAAELAALHRQHLDAILFPVAYDFTIEADEATEITDVAATSDPPVVGSVFHRQTIFPPGPTAQSLHSVLLQLSRATDNADFRVTWRDRHDDPHEATMSVQYDPLEADWFESAGIRTDVALHRYFRAVQAWCRGQVAQADSRRPMFATPAELATRLTRIRSYLVDEQATLETDQFSTDIAVIGALSGENDGVSS